MNNIEGIHVYIYTALILTYCINIFLWSGFRHYKRTPWKRDVTLYEGQSKKYTWNIILQLEEDNYLWNNIVNFFSSKTVYKAAFKID